MSYTLVEVEGGVPTVSTDGVDHTALIDWDNIKEHSEEAVRILAVTQSHPRMQQIKRRILELHPFLNGWRMQEFADDDQVLSKVCLSYDECVDEVHRTLDALDPNGFEPGDVYTFQIGRVCEVEEYDELLYLHRLKLEKGNDRS